MKTSELSSKLSSMFRSEEREGKTVYLFSDISAVLRVGKDPVDPVALACYESIDREMTLDVAYAFAAYASDALADALSESDEPDASDALEALDVYEMAVTVPEYSNYVLLSVLNVRNQREIWTLGVENSCTDLACACAWYWENGIREAAGRIVSELKKRIESDGTEES